MGKSLCGHCGNALAEAARFCPFCGTSAVPQRLSEAAHVPGFEGARGGARAPGPGRARFVAVRLDGTDGDQYPLDRDQIDIGRGAGEIRFDDPQLATRHLRISVTRGACLLTPLDRVNGAFLRLRGAFEVSDGDVILLGLQVLRFETLPPHERELPAATENGVLLFGTPARPAPWGRLRQLSACGVGRDVYHISRPEIVMGREHVDVVFADDEFLSRRHARLALQDGRPRLEDLGSSNGTYVRLRGPHPLAPGDYVRFGDQLLRFELG